MRLLAIDAEPHSAAYLRRGLRAHGHVVDMADGGVDGLHLATSGCYAAILMAVELPGIDGWQVLRRIRARQPTPVLLLSRHDLVEDRVKGLQLGADDYLVKPFAFAELLARIQAVVRRSGPPSAAASVLRVADLEIDCARRAVRRASARIVLSAKEFLLLEFLARHAGQAQSRTLIAESVWHMHFDCNSNVIDVAVRRLRAKIDDPFPRKLIHTVRGFGYVLEAEGAAAAVLAQA